MCTGVLPTWVCEQDGDGGRHHAGWSTKGRPRAEIEFDVVLREDGSALPMSYKGPVGSIMF